MAAGAMNKRVRIMRASNGAATGSGAVTPVYAELCHPWAEIAPYAGREFQAALTTVPLLQSIVKIRWNATSKTITARDRVVLGDRTLEIAAVFNEGEKNRRMVLWCVE